MSALSMKQLVFPEVPSLVELDKFDFPPQSEQIVPLRC